MMVKESAIKFAACSVFCVFLIKPVAFSFLSCFLPRHATSLLKIQQFDGGYNENNVHRC